MGEAVQHAEKIKDKKEMRNEDIEVCLRERGSQDPGGGSESRKNAMVFVREREGVEETLNPEPYLNSGSLGQGRTSKALSVSGFRVWGEGVGCRV